MKGFIITIDAIAAFFILLVATVWITSYSFQPVAPRGVYLKQVTLDTLTVLEKTGRMDLAVEGNSSSVQDILQATPELVCIQMTIVNEHGEDVATITKANCGTYGRELQTAARSFIHNGRPYMVKSESWYRKGAS
jgi:hypothetical protein